MRDAVTAGRRVRLHLWNEGQDRVGFWCIVSLHPVHVNGSDGEGKLKYFCGLQLRLSPEQMRDFAVLTHELESHRAQEASDFMYDWKSGSGVPTSIAGATVSESGSDDSEQLLRAVREWRERYRQANGAPPTKKQVLAALTAASTDLGSP